MEASRPVPPRDDLLRIDRGYAIKQDGEDLDGLNHIREEFWIPKISAMQSSVLPVGGLRHCPPISSYQGQADPYEQNAMPLRPAALTTSRRG